MITSAAYLNQGRWVADCPVEWCGDALALYPQDPRTGIVAADPAYVQSCAKGHQFRINAPPDRMRARIEAVLASRPEEYRDWLPDGHPWGASHGYPTGQSVEDLAAENEELARRLAEQAKPAAPSAIGLTGGDLREVLASLGVTVRADGSFSGVLPGSEK